MLRLATNTFLLTMFIAGGTWLTLGHGQTAAPVPLPETEPPAARATQPKRIIYFFTRPDCVYCPPMHKLANQLHREGHTVYVVNSSRQDLVRKYGVSAYPTFLVVEGRTIVRRVIGLTTKERVLGDR